MRSLVIILFVLLPFTNINAQDEVIRLSEPVTITEQYETFGTVLELGNDENIISLDEAIRQSGSDQEFIIKANVKQVCKKRLLLYCRGRVG